MGNMGLDRARPEVECLGDFLVGLSPPQQAQDLHLALSQTSWVAFTWRRCAQTSRECGGPGECWRRLQRGAQVTDIVQKSCRLKGIALRRVELGDGKKRQRPFEWRLAGVGQVESGRQVSLGVNEIAEHGLDLAKETMGSKTDQRLIRCA